MENDSATRPVECNDPTRPVVGKLWRRVLPSICSIGLVAWLLWRIPIRQLYDAAKSIDWGLLGLLTVGLVAALYLWDAYCVRWVFSQPAGSVAYIEALRARGTAYLAGAINYSVGQGVLAWMMARTRGIALASALARMALIAYHDLWLLLTLGLIGSYDDPDPRVRITRFACVAGIGLLATLTAVAYFAPARWRDRLNHNRWTSWFTWWSWNRSLTLIGMRLTNSAISIVYAAVGLYFCNVDWHLLDLFRAIAFLQLAEALPITVSGLGARETMLITVIKPAATDRVLAFGLVWSVGIIIGRIAIGLVNLAIARGQIRRNVQSSVPMPPGAHNSSLSPANHATVR